MIEGGVNAADATLRLLAGKGDLGDVLVVLAAATKFAAMVDPALAPEAAAVALAARIEPLIAKGIREGKIPLPKGAEHPVKEGQSAPPSQTHGRWVGR